MTTLHNIRNTCELTHLAFSLGWSIATVVQSSPINEIAIAESWKNKAIIVNALAA